MRIPAWAVALLAAFLLVPVVYFLATRPTQPKTTTTPVIRFSTTSSKRPVTKETTTTTTDYWVYGRLAQDPQEDGTGIHTRVILEGNPLDITSPVFIRKADDAYTLRVYDEAFGGKYTVQFLPLAEFTKIIFDQKPVVELRIQFLTSRVTQEDADTMAAIEAAGAGQWEKFPSHELLVNFIGVVKETP